MADIEVNDRWGVNVVEGFYAAHYTNFAKEKRELRLGEWIDEIGFHNTQKTRPLIIGAVQSWLSAYHAGVPYGRCRSRKYIETLMDCILDEDGKIVAAPGLHDERLITLGQNLRRAVTRSGRDIPSVYTPPQTETERLAAMIRGEFEAEPERSGYQVPAMERPRW